MQWSGGLVYLAIMFSTTMLMSGRREDEERAAVLIGLHRYSFIADAAAASRDKAHGATGARHLESVLSGSDGRQREESDTLVKFAIVMICVVARANSGPSDCTSSNLSSPPPLPPHNRLGVARHQERSLDAAQKSRPGLHRFVSVAQHFIVVAAVAATTALTVYVAELRSGDIERHSQQEHSRGDCPSVHHYVLALLVIDTEDSRERAVWRSRRDSSAAAGRLVLAVPLLVLATLASVRRPGASWRMLGGVGAEFAPRNRRELQGDGGAEEGVFGCVGECGRTLSSSSSDSFCRADANGPWESGNGVPARTRTATSLATRAPESTVPSSRGTSAASRACETVSVCVMCLLKRDLLSCLGCPVLASSLALVQRLLASCVFHQYRSLRLPVSPFRVLPLSFKVSAVLV